MGTATTSDLAAGNEARKVRVLLVETASFFATHLGGVLGDLGCETEVVKTIADARSQVRHNDFDLIIIARHLPDGKATEFAAELRTDAASARIPLVMLTADESQGIFEKAYEAGFTEVFFRGELPRISEYLQHFVKSRHEERRLVGRVLYLEDTKWMATVTIGILHSLGLMVDHFTSVAPALEAFEKKDYDIIITDIVLEGSESGVSLVRQIRQLGDRRGSVPILAITGLEDTARRIELFRSGVSDYICKPVLTEELVARLSHLIINRQLLETVQRQQENLRSLAATDVLTGLPNRRHLTQEASASLAWALHSHEALSIILFDIDHFKRLNDTFGHSAGDAALEAVGFLLRDYCAGTNLSPARFGGEEFLILCPGSDLDAAMRVAEDLRERVERETAGEQSFTISCGVAALEGESEFHHLFDIADKALYRAKEGGRNRVERGRREG